MRNPLSRRAGRVLLVAFALFAALFATTSSASAAYGYYPGAGVHYGNHCNYSQRFLDNAGAEACLFVLGGSRSSLTVAGGVYDYAADGRNVHTQLTVQNVASSGAVLTSAVQNVYGTSGYRYGKVGSSFTVYKHASAPYHRVTLRACTVRPSDGAFISCASNSWTYGW